jgi:hypothetical protein
MEEEMQKNKMGEDKDPSTESICRDGLKLDLLV